MKVGVSDLLRYKAQVVAHAPLYLVIVRLEVVLPQYGTAPQPPRFSQRIYRYCGFLNTIIPPK